MSDTLTGFPDFFRYAVFQLLQTCGGSVGSGSRTTEEQQLLVDEKGLWSPTNPGAAPAGTSNHEVGVGYGAADMEGDLECMHANAAKFGLVFPMSNEPWHVEPGDELIAAGMGYFGLEPGMDPNAAKPEQRAEDPLSFAERLVMGSDEEDVGDVSAEPTGPRSAPGASEAPAIPAPAPADGGTLSDVEAAEIMAQAGFRGEALVTALAVAIGESGLNPGVPGPTIAPDGGLGRPQGLFQIREDSAMYRSGGWRDGTRLHDPLFNAKAAFAISNGGTNWQPWEVYTAGIYQENVARARAAVAAIGGGASPMPATPPPGPTGPDSDDLASPDDPVSVGGSDVVAPPPSDVVANPVGAEVDTGMRQREEFASA